MRERRKIQKQINDQGRDRSGRQQDRTGRQQDRTGRQQDRTERQQPGRQKPSGATNRENKEQAVRRERERQYKERVKALRATVPHREGYGCLACPCLEHFGSRYVAFWGQQLRITAGEYAGELGYALDIPVFCAGWLTVAEKRHGLSSFFPQPWHLAPCHAPSHVQSSGRRFCFQRLYCASPACKACDFEESRHTTVGWRLPVGADGMLAITEPQHHYRVQLHKHAEPVLVSPYHVEPFPQTRDHAYDLGYLDLPVPDARMYSLDGAPHDVCTVEHFLGASFHSEGNDGRLLDEDDDHRLLDDYPHLGEGYPGGYLGHYRCTRTVYAKPEHVQCATDADTEILSISNALMPGGNDDDGRTYHLRGYHLCDCPGQRGSIVRSSYFRRIDAVSKAPSGWAGKLRMGARARLLPPHEQAEFESWDGEAFFVTRICACGECVELTHTFTTGSTDLEPLDDHYKYCPDHHTHKCAHLGHRGACAFRPRYADESESSSEPDEECAGAAWGGVDLEAMNLT
jgi:hypothetical protein